MKATVKLTWSQPCPFVVLETDAQVGATRVELVLEIVSVKALSRNGGKVLISVQYIRDHPITLGYHMLMGRVSALALIEAAGGEGNHKLSEFLSYS